MKFKSALVTQVSGSVGGMTGSHNKGGMYFRSRTIPTNPNSSQQQTIRSTVADLSNRWTNILTPAQRAAWDVYAANVLLPGPLGDPRPVSGLNMYVRSNVPRIQSGLPRVDDGPTTFDLGEYTAPTIVSATAATGVISVGFEDTDAWLDEDDSALLVFGSRPQNPSINYFKGPYRVSGTVLGNGTTPLTSPQPVTNPFALTIGNRVFVRAVVTRADGRLSTPTFLTGLAV